MIFPHFQDGIAVIDALVADLFIPWHHPAPSWAHRFATEYEKEMSEIICIQPRTEQQQQKQSVGEGVGEEQVIRIFNLRIWMKHNHKKWGGLLYIYTNDDDDDERRRVWSAA